jgi:linoleoyl-CoA desaturase
MRVDSLKKTTSNFVRPRFAKDSGFHRELNRRIQLCVGHEKASQRESRELHIKTVVMLCWFAASYTLLVFLAGNVWQALAGSLSLAFAIAGIGFNIQHDANHGAYSDRTILNRSLGFTLDLLGASSYVWRFKHNVLHHTYTNLSQWDDDLDLGFFGRLSPAQRQRRVYRAQQYYLWLVYGFLGPKWHFIDDFVNIIQGRIGSSQLRRPTGWDFVGLAGGKLVFITLAFVLPLLGHPFWKIAVFYAFTWFVAGLVVSVVFQLAHCVEDAKFPDLPAMGSRLQTAWAAHQVQSTVNFAPQNRLLTWYLGGLNHQIEHHLFPTLSHVHYSRISREVRAVCAEFGVRYFAYSSMFRAILSHFRWLRRLGKGTENFAGLPLPSHDL